jgi:hypothetical protein
MTFFQDYPIPTPPARPRNPQFTPPAWVTAPRYELPAVVPVGQFLYKSHTFVIAIEAAKVYSTGCVFETSWMLRRTDQDDRRWSEMNAVFHRPAPHLRDGAISVDSVLLFGMQFPDGTKTSTSSLAMYEQSAPLDQKPDGPVFEFRPKGGNGGDDDMSATGMLWLWPLPPAGDLRLLAQWTSMGMPESSIVLDGGRLQAAAASVQKFWPEEGVQE